MFNRKAYESDKRKGVIKTSIVLTGNFVARRWASKSDVFEEIKAFALNHEIVHIGEKRKLFTIEYTVHIQGKQLVTVEKVVEKIVEVEVEKIVKVPTIKYVEKDRLGNIVVGSGKSRFRGVSKKQDRFYATIQHNGKKKWLGSFTSEFEAAEAYDNAAKKIHGDKAILNFPKETVAK